MTVAALALHSMDLAVTHTTIIAQLTKMAFSAVAVRDGAGKQLLLFFIFIQAIHIFFKMNSRYVITKFGFDDDQSLYL
jgi:hypothetical protein